MFLDFFYALRSGGLNVSLDEWLTLTDALDRGLCDSSFTKFYYLCRNVLVKSEADYDKFDMLFAEFFKGLEAMEELPPEFWDWLNTDVHVRDINDKPSSDEQLTLEQLIKRFQERIAEQKERHDEGSYWIGTGGRSTMGHSGYNDMGIRTGGEGRHRTAVQIAGERKFRDFRQDEIMDIRHFQMAFRKLRQFSTRVDAQKTELDIDATIDETCENAGNLKLVFEKPRKNTVKLLLLFDSDGSMASYSRLCSRLFQAAHQSNHFKDLQVYYFHNCIYEHLFTSPHCLMSESVETEWVFSNLGSDYKVIIIGDASMSMYELLDVGGNIYYSRFNEEPGIEWLKKVRRKYGRAIWMNPIPESRWETAYGWRSIAEIREVFPMFELSLDGLEAGIKKLMVR